MKEEIKEILEQLEWYRKIGKKNICYPECVLPNKKAFILLDYITSLQEENERLKNGYCELKVKCNNGECDCTNEEYESMAQANMKGSLLLEDYKQRNEKAIEFIEEKISSTKGVINDYMYHKEHNKILIELLQEDIELYKKELDILKGDKDE